MIVLKRLSDAVAARDRIWAVIKGSAVNQDGLTNGLTAPNGRSQRAVITSALDNARIAASQVTLIEAHGTGTALGDPIEVESLAEVYGEMSADSDACALGSVKTNIGHLEAGAGIVGLIKTILSIHHGAITPHLHLESVNPHITLDGNRLFIPTSLQPWDVPDEHRHGAVSSFGAGGTNAHVILGPAARDVATPPTPGEAHLIPISARTDQALRAMVRAHRDHLRSPEGQAAPLRDIAYTATFRRTHHEHRCAVVARSHTEAADRLTAWLQGEAPTGVVAGRPSSGVGDGVVFVFPGQGSQRAGMGRELMRCCPAFRAAVMECDQAMRQWLGRSVIDEIHGIDDDAQLDRIDVIQPALFALAVGLAARWRSFGIEPDVVVGHSMGEVAAAHVAGALSLDDATRIICRRSSLLRRVSGTGAMLVVALPLEEADRLLDGYRGRVSLAVSNSPTSTVLSGDPALLTELGETLQRRNVFCRPVKVDVASHSPQMDLLRDELLDALSGLSPIRSTVPILSTVTGELCDGATFDAEYWVRNLREPVLFWSAIQSLIKQGNGAFVEMSPHPILLSAVEQGFELTGREGLVLPAMRRDDPEAHGVLETVGALHTHGIPARWDALRRSDARPVVLPGYVWQHESFWFRGAVAGTAPIPAPRGAVIPPSGGGESELLRRLRPADTRERREILFATVLDVVSGVLGFDGARVDSRAGFFQLGMDSLMAAQVRIRLDAALQRKLPSTVMFEHSTVESLSRHLADLPIVGSEPVDSASGQRQSSVAAVPVSEHHRPRQDVAELIDGLSEDELLAVLAAEVRNSNPEAASA